MRALLCRDGAVVAVAQPTVDRCTTLKHMWGDCGTSALPVAVPLDGADVEKVDLFCCGLLPPEGIVCSCDEVYMAMAVDLLRAADFLDCAPLVRHLAWPMAHHLTWLFDEWDLPTHLLCVLARCLCPDRLAAVLLSRPDMATTLEAVTGPWTLAGAARRGHVVACQWLVEQRQLTAADARANDNCALRHAAAHGRLEVCRWLVKHFDLTIADARATNNYALRRAAANGHIKTCRWLFGHFLLLPSDGRAAGNYALRHACKNGHLPVAQWLQCAFNLRAADVRALDNWAHRRALARGHTAVAEWIAEHSSARDLMLVVLVGRRILTDM